MPQAVRPHLTRLSDFSVLTFDCYGTLIDWEAGMVDALRPLTERANLSLSRDDVLTAHAVHETSQQSQTPHLPYRDLLAIVFKRLAEQWGVHASHEQCVAYGGSVGSWPVFPDTIEALRYLKRFYKLVIASNVDNRSFAATAHRLEVLFDAVVTAEDAGAYKPAAAMFTCLLARLRAGLGGEPIVKTSILHTAESLFHDHAPANAIGLASCWIHRRHAQDGFGATLRPADMPRFDFRFTSMAAMAEAHRAELAAATT